MKIKEIYKIYLVPPNLQQHMLRVAGISKVIAENWRGATLDIETIITACLVHDIGNILKFDLENKAYFLGEEEKNLEYWKKVKLEMSQKYGPDEHDATATICGELRLDSKALWVVNNWGFGNFDKVLQSANLAYKICVYSDHRIGPFGVVDLKDRFSEQRKRYEEHKYKSSDTSAHLSERAEYLIDCAYRIEQQLQKNISKDLNSISDQEVETNFSLFLEQEI